MAVVKDASWWEFARHEYVAKNDELARSAGWYWCDPTAFYGYLFTGIEMEQAGQMIDWDEPGGGHPNAIVLEITGEKYLEAQIVNGVERQIQRPVIHRYTLTEDLDGVMPLVNRSLEQNSTMFVSPVTYFGKNRTAANARYLHAFTVDLDGVRVEHLNQMLYEMRKGFFPQASAVVNSGTGVHLYYMLEKPIPLYPKNIAWLQALKTALTDRVWYEDTSDLPDRQYQGIYQGFRLVGSSTKLNGGQPESKVTRKYETTAFIYADGFDIWRVDLDYLRANVIIQKGSILQTPFDKFRSTVPLEAAKEKWPEWYERRIVHGDPAGQWQCNRGLYDWFFRKLQDGKSVTVHHRYHCIRALAAYADKCGISREELEEDAFSLLDEFEAKTKTPDNHFTESDILAALDEAGTGARLTRAYIERSTAISIPANKRNGRTREKHCEVMRAIQNIDDPEGSWRNKAGAPTKEKLVHDYASAHPGSSQRQIAKALGISPTTVNKWLKS